MNKNDGGPAFPFNELLHSNMTNVAQQYSGATLRDIFAGMAMLGILAGDLPITRNENPLEEIANIAYKQADAMLKERLK